QLIGFTPKDLQVNLSHEVSKIFKFFFIDKLFGVVAAAIYGNVDCEDYLSHLIVPDPFLMISDVGFPHRIVELSDLQRPGDLVKTEDDAGWHCFRADELE